MTDDETRILAVFDQVQAAVRDGRVDKPQAAAERRCVAPPMGCGLPLAEGRYGPFRDTASQREYELTGYCQACQDKFFAPPLEEVQADPGWERCGECGEYRELQYVDVGVGVMSGHNCCAEVRFGGAPPRPRCGLTPHCVFAHGHAHHCEVPDGLA